MKTIRVALYCLLSLSIIAVVSPASAVVYVESGHPVKREALEHYWRLQGTIKYEPLFDWKFAPFNEKDPEMLMDVTNEGNRVYLKAMAPLSADEAMKAGLKVHFTKGCQPKVSSAGASGSPRKAEGSCNGRQYLLMVQSLSSGLVVMGVASWPKGTEGVAMDLETLMEGLDVLTEEERNEILEGQRNGRSDTVMLEYPEAPTVVGEDGKSQEKPWFENWGEGLSGSWPWQVVLGTLGGCGAIRLDVFGRDATPKGALADYWLKDIEDRNRDLQDVTVRHNQAGGISQGLVSYGSVTEAAVAATLNVAGTVMIEASWHESCAADVQSAMKSLVASLHAADEVSEEPTYLKIRKGSWLF